MSKDDGSAWACATWSMMQKQRRFKIKAGLHQTLKRKVISLIQLRSPKKFLKDVSVTLIHFHKETPLEFNYDKCLHWSNREQKCVLRLEAASCKEFYYFGNISKKD